VLATGLTNVSDVALGEVTTDGVQVYVTTEGTDAAIGVNFALDLTPVLPGSTALLEASSRSVAEFSAVSPSRLDVVVTLVQGSQADVAAVPATVVIPNDETAVSEATPTQPLDGVVPVALLVEGGDDTLEVSTEGLGTTTESDESAVLERSAVISGTAEEPLHRRPGQSDGPSEVPLGDPCDVFEVGQPVPVLPQQEEVLQEVSRWTLGQEVPWRQVCNLPEDGHGKLQTRRHDSGETQSVSDTAFTNWDFDDQSERLLSIGDLGGASEPRLRALAICLASMYMVRERPSRTRRQALHSPRRPQS
jgi:hypothetical protein